MAKSPSGSVQNRTAASPAAASSVSIFPRRNLAEISVRSSSPAATVTVRLRSAIVTDPAVTRPTGLASPWRAAARTAAACAAVPDLLST